MSSLTHLRGRVAAIGGVIVLLLVAGVWIALTHASAQSSRSHDGGSGHGRQRRAPARRRRPRPARCSSCRRRRRAMRPASAATTDDQDPVLAAPLAAGFADADDQARGGRQLAGRRTSTLEFVPEPGLRPADAREGDHSRRRRPASGRRTARLLGKTVKLHSRPARYQTARLAELLAQLGYLPLTWTASAGATVPGGNRRGRPAAAAYSPPQGSYTWQSGYPSQLKAFWQNGAADSLILKGAVMAFEADHGPRGGRRRRQPRSGAPCSRQSPPSRHNTTATPTRSPARATRRRSRSGTTAGSS